MSVSAILTAVAKSLATKFVSWGYNKITKTNITEYESELYDIIYKTIEDFEKANPIKETDKIPFYTSQLLLDEFLKFRFTSKMDLKLVEQEFIRDERIINPTEKELELFYQFFDTNIKNSKKLHDLNIECNYKEEVFNISAEVKSIQSTLLDIKEVIKNETPKDNSLSEYESKLLLRLFNYQSPCKIASAKGEFECLWVPGDICDMQWGWERTQAEVELSRKSRGDRDSRLHWILVVKQLVEKGYLIETESKLFELTEAGLKAAYKIKHGTI